MKVEQKDTLCCLSSWEDNCLRQALWAFKDTSWIIQQVFWRTTGNFSHPFSSMQSSSLPLVMVKVMVAIRSRKVLPSCWEMGRLSLKCLSLKCFTPTPKNTPHLMLISSQYLHTKLDLEHFSMFCSTPGSLVFVFRLVTSPVLSTLGVP